MPCPNPQARRYRDHGQSAGPQGHRRRAGDQSSGRDAYLSSEVLRRDRSCARGVGLSARPPCVDAHQFLYSVTGLMRVRTQAEAWIVPPDRAVYLPARVEHSIGIRGLVTMSTLYIAPRVHDGLPDAPTVLEVSPLLRELLLALIAEPVVYD